MKRPQNRIWTIRLWVIVSATLFHCLNHSGCSNAQDTSAKSAGSILKRFVDECVIIRPGSDGYSQQFQMGGHFEDPLALPERSVRMSQPFRICKYETTQELYVAVMGNNPSRWKGPRNSVESMSFPDSESFCSKLTISLQNANLIEAQEIVRLPTEAEWEYCCRAGTGTRYSFGDTPGAETDKDPIASILNEYAWHTGNAAGNDPAVGILKPNPWGLFDMHGYLWEYVSDPEVIRKSDDRTNPAAQTSTCIIRGGSWKDRASHLTSGARRLVSVNEPSDAVGFRCVIALKNDGTQSNRVPPTHR